MFNLQDEAQERVRVQMSAMRKHCVRVLRQQTCRQTSRTRRHTFRRRKGIFLLLYVHNTINNLYY